MRVGILSQVWRYPVKSMGGERLEGADLTSRGIPGDRGWAVFDDTRQGITGAKRLPALRACRARYPSEPVVGEPPPAAEITLPDGDVVSTDSPRAAQRLSELVGRPVALRALGGAGAPSAPRITTHGEPEETVRAIMGVLPDEPMPDMSGFTPERLRMLREDNFFDAFPIHLLTSTTLRTLAHVAPDSLWDERRFRPNLFVETDEPEGYPELGWLERRLLVGSSEIQVVTGCPRCVMSTQAVDEIPQDHRIMRTLVREIRHTAGIYAGIATAGRVSLGDEVRLVE
jgi:uncharacterized protein YcbX